MKRTVLIVEDQALIAEDHRWVLEDLGWRVLETAASVAAAQSALDRETPDVALLDINLGRELVTPFARVLLERAIPFVVSSASADLVVVNDSVFSGIVNVGKPTSPAALNQALLAALR